MVNDNGAAYEHMPVFWREIAGYIEASPHGGRGALVDATLGEGGHSELLLRTFQEMEIIGLDRDGEIMKIAEKRLEPFASRVTLYNENFSDISDVPGIGERAVNYILYDFGISSYHLNRPGRGFSFGIDEALDMRLDRTARLDARDVVNEYDEARLADIIFRYGGERWAKKIATVICRKRREKRVETTGELAGIVLGAIPKRFHVKNIHPATRVFQAVRIEVNGELRAIEKGLAGGFGLLSPGGLVLAMSYHSLEDKIVKEFFRRMERGCRCENDVAHCMCMGGKAARLLTKKPVRPGDDEVQMNRRARSARLRVCEKIDVERKG